MRRKFYVVGRFAEDYAYGIVELTDTEMRGVRKFVDTDMIFAGDFCGVMGLSTKGFNTYDEAFEFMTDVCNGKADFN